ncbi:hypothetical protein BDN72DRAFT_845744 [Pluteus cervinus]|uniref:Uncharacterized protein n=1 Tax=Pluteus cervinus TaxID=181527 RepID=A0ACD3AHY6_9AGAR|nr:hypothetical protein BDN72DRAFT_845744 [Pluteus cervinus]
MGLLGHLQVPFDVMSTIFEISANDSRSVSGSSGFIARSIDLCLVSREWQAIAHSTHRLWTHVRIRREKDTLTKEHLKLAIAYLARSKGLPCYLHIDIEYEDLPSEDAKSIIHELVKPNLPRMEMLDIFGSPKFLRAALDLFPLQCPKLEGFGFGRPDRAPLEDGRDLEIPDSTFLQCPLLVFLELVDISPKREATLGSFKALQALWPLCEIVLENIPLDYMDVYQLLSSCQEVLGSCKFIAKDEIPGPVVELPPITLHNLRDIHLSSLCHVSLLDSLTLPALRSLRLCAVDDVDGHCLYALCKRSQFDLVTFVATGFLFEADELCEILTDNPRLSTLLLELSEVGDFEQLFLHLAGRNEAAYNFPALIDLTVSESEAPMGAADYLAVLEFLVSRSRLWDSGARLRVDPEAPPMQDITAADAFRIAHGLKRLMHLTEATFMVKCLCKLFPNLPEVCWCEFNDGSA